MLTNKRSAGKTVRDIRRATWRHYSAEEKIRIVLEGLRGEDSIAELCRREGINSNLYYRWSKEFLEAGKKRLSGDTAREATSDEVKHLRSEATALKETLAEFRNLLEHNLDSLMGADCGKWRDHWLEENELCPMQHRREFPFLHTLVSQVGIDGRIHICRAL